MPGKPTSRPQSAFFASDEHGRLRIAAVRAVVPVAAFDSDGLRAGSGHRVTHRERTKR
jgi:hypothetical protein